MKKEFYPFLFLCFFLCAAISSYAQPPGYTYVREITIQESQIPDGASLVDFPVLLKMTDLSLRSSANGGHVENNNGYDILVYQSPCDSPLDYQLEYYDPVTGEINIWVRLPLLSTTADTRIYLYYGNPAVIADGSSTNTWQSSYSAIWHLSNNPTLAAPSILDATANVHHGTAHGSLPASSLVAGKIGRALRFDESNDYVRIPDFLYGQELTMSFWFNASEVNGTTYQYVFSHGGWGLQNSLNVYIGEDNITIPAEIPNRSMIKTVFRDMNDANNFDTLNAGNSFIDGNWHYYTMRIQDHGGAYIYIDGNVVAVYSVWGANVFDPVTDLFLGGREDLNPGRFYGGLLDEVRISSVWRSSNWIRTEYNNQNDPTVFLAIGAETQPVVFCTPLSSKIFGLTANTAGSTVKLQWQSNEYSEPGRFIIERSSNSTSWYAIGSTSRDQFSDSLPVRGISYYRVRHLKKNTEEISSIVRVDYLFTGHTIHVYPNPSPDGIFYAELSTSEMPEQVTLIDAKGKYLGAMQVEKTGRTSYRLKQNSFPGKGVYIVRFKFRSGVENYRVVVQ
jgi:hypothetical protein